MFKNKFLLQLVIFLCASIISIDFEAQNAAKINVDAGKEIGWMKPIWAWWGYDEPNYTYMKDGKKLLSEIASFSPVPVNVRAHGLLVRKWSRHKIQRKNKLKRLRKRDNYIFIRLQNIGTLIAEN